MKNSFSNTLQWLIAFIAFILSFVAMHGSASAQTPETSLPPVVIVGPTIALLNQETELSVIIAEPAKVPVITILRGGATFAQFAPMGNVTKFKVTNTFVGPTTFVAQTAIGNSPEFKQEVIASSKVILMGPPRAVEGQTVSLVVTSSPKADLGVVTLLKGGAGGTTLAQQLSKDGRAVFTLNNLVEGTTKYLAQTSGGDSNEFTLIVVKKGADDGGTGGVNCVGGVNVSASSMNLGTATSGTAGRTDTLTIRNGCNIVIEIVELKATGAFSIAKNTCGPTITPNETCEIGVQFTPKVSETGPKGGSVSFRARASGGGVSIDLRVTISVKGFAAKDIFARSDSFVEQQYIDFYDRLPEENGRRIWQAAIDDGSLSRERFVRAMLESPEFDSAVAPLVRFYSAALGRTPDRPGLLDWMAKIKSGAVTLEQVAQAFASSPEFLALYGNLSDDAFVKQVYETVFGRLQDAAGGKYWSDRLKAGQESRGSLLLKFAESVEGKAIADPEVKVYSAYSALLQRDPERAGFEYHVSRVQRGASIDDLLKAFIDSPEYRGRFIPNGQ